MNNNKNKVKIKSKKQKRMLQCQKPNLQILRKELVKEFGEDDVIQL